MNRPAAIPRVSPGQAVSAAHYNQLVDAVNALRQISFGRGFNVVQNSGGIGVALDASAFGRPERFQFFRITDATQDGSNYRWTYTARKIVKNAAGYDGWSDDEDDLNDHTLYNLNEDQNGATGTFGNGTTSANLDTDDATFTVQAIPDETRVLARSIQVEDEAEWWIVNLPNGVDGVCD